MVLAESLRAAEQQADEDTQLRALWAMWSFRYNSGQMRAAQPLAERFAQVAAPRPGRTAEGFVGDRLLGTTLHHIGRHSEARRHPSACAISTLRRRITGTRCGSTTISAFVGPLDPFSRIWLQGFPDQARDNASASVGAARSGDHKLTLCYALNMAACPIAILTGDIDHAQRTLVELTDIVNSHSVAFWQALTNCATGHVMVRQGRFADGAAVLNDALTACDRLGGTTWYPEFQGALAEGLAGSGRPVDALATIDHALAKVDRDGEHWCTPELLRLKGEFMLLPEVGRPDEAEGRFVQALEAARQQGALSWELRAAMSLARLRDDGTARPAEARQLLAPVYAQFSEGFATLDLRAAYAMLVTGARE